MATRTGAVARASRRIQLGARRCPLPCRPAPSSSPSASTGEPACAAAVAAARGRTRHAGSGTRCRRQAAWMATRETGLKRWYRNRSILALAGVLFLLAGCRQEAPQPEREIPPPPKPDVILIEPVLPERPPRPELPPLFRDIERRTFQFFWDTTNEQNGLTPDRFPSRPF